MNDAHKRSVILEGDTIVVPMPNKNGRIYPPEVVAEGFRKYAAGECPRYECEHPSAAEARVREVVHMKAFDEVRGHCIVELSNAMFQRMVAVLNRERVLTRLRNIRRNRPHRGGRHGLSFNARRAIGRP